MADELGGAIVLAIIATIVAIVIGTICLFLNMNWASFVIGVALAGIGLGLISDDLISAGIAGGISGLLTAALKGVVISIFWGGWVSYMFGMMYGGQFLLLIFVGAIFAAGSNMLLSGKG